MIVKSAFIRTPCLACGFLFQHSNSGRKPLVPAPDGPAKGENRDQYCSSPDQSMELGAEGNDRCQDDVRRQGCEEAEYTFDSILDHSVEGR